MIHYSAIIKRFSILVLFFNLIYCKSSKINFRESRDYHSKMDGQTLYADYAPYLMPYNRILDPAGESVHFGDGTLENHSLDAITLPDNETLVVEDRYGIALFDMNKHKLIARWSYNQDVKLNGSMSTYSGINTIVYHDSTFIFWGAGGRDILFPQGRANSYVIMAYWDPKAEQKIKLIQVFPFKAEPPASIALPNQVIPTIENGALYFFTVLNGNNKVVKVSVKDQHMVWESATGMAPFGLGLVDHHLYVTNWAGSMPDSTDGKETAGIPWGRAYIDPQTGAMSGGSVSIFNATSGQLIKEISVGLHPNAIICSPDHQTIYVANGNSDYVSVIDIASASVIDSISVGLFNTHKNYIGSTPNALAIDKEGKQLFVANGLDNAICMIDLKPDSSGRKYSVKGYIPTEAYPSGIVLRDNECIVTNLESTGARAQILAPTSGNTTSVQKKPTPFNAHRQLASVSFIPIPTDERLRLYTDKVKKLSHEYRLKLSDRLPRAGILPKPVPERTGEPSVFKHVLYIIKENRTYDQVLGDMPEGRGMRSLCIFGDTVTPNQHKLARDFVLLDNYYASGKGSAEGHHWVNAGMVTDYTEKMVRAWFRSYPHVLYDAMVYNKNGLIWNNALDHGKSVKIYGEACNYEYDKSKYNWKTLYDMWQNGSIRDFNGISTTTISRVRPILSQTFPGGSDLAINDQMRADAYIKELKETEALPGDQLPNLMVMALPNDHTAGTSPNFPTPRAMVADNDAAVGRIVEAVMKSKFAESTVIFITEDDSQAGWDHISAYRTTGFVISAYSRLKKTVQTNYNQTSMLRTMELILGLPPMNVIDATALPMFDCFESKPNVSFVYKALKNNIPLDEMNPGTMHLQGSALKFSKQSVQYNFHLIDQGHDDLLNRILWYAAKKNQPYPAHFAGEYDGDD